MALFAHNSSFVGHPGGQVFCQQYYGTWADSHACVSAIDKLRRGPDKITYSTGGGGGARALPHYVQSGGCMVQVEAAGPRLPATFEIAPDEIRSMADKVLRTCVEGTDRQGGFLTSSLHGLIDWITDPNTDLSDYYPQHTSFITVTISNTVPDWISPGNYDPIIAHILAQAEFGAIRKARGGSPLRDDLRRRGDRFLRQEQRMEPRGSRAPWWDDPGKGVPGGRIGGNLTVGESTTDLVAELQVA